MEVEREGKERRENNNGRKISEVIWKTEERWEKKRIEGSWIVKKEDGR